MNRVPIGHSVSYMMEFPRLISLARNLASKMGASLLRFFLLIATATSFKVVYPSTATMWSECTTNCQKSRTVDGGLQMKGCYNEGQCKHKSERDKILASYSYIFTQWSSWLDCDNKCIRKRHRMYKDSHSEAYLELTKTITGKRGLLVDTQVCKDKGCHRGGPFPNIPCGQIEHAIKPRVIGGEASTVEKWPWQVSIVERRESPCNDFDTRHAGAENHRCPVKTNYTHHCGGTLISSSWVLTAAHCVTRPRSKRKRKLKISVIVGLTNLQNLTENTDRIYDVAEIIAHPKWTWKVGQNYNHDIALIKLAKEVTQDQRSACVPLASSHLPAGTTCMALGWGVTSQSTPSPNTPVKGAIYSNVLMEVDLKVINRKVCKSSLRKSGAFLTKNQVCAGHHEGKKDTCEGDSGGPLLCNTSGRKWAIHGITSYGPTNCASKGNYGVYTRVRNYVDWIIGKTKDFGRNISRKLRLKKKNDGYSFKRRKLGRP